MVEDALEIEAPGVHAEHVVVQLCDIAWNGVVAEHNSNFKDNSIDARVGGNQSRGIRDPTVEGDMESRSLPLGRVGVTGSHASQSRGDARPEVALPLKSGGRSHSVRGGTRDRAGAHDGGAREPRRAITAARVGGARTTRVTTEATECSGKGGAGDAPEASGGSNRDTLVTCRWVGRGGGCADT